MKVYQQKLAEINQTGSDIFRVDAFCTPVPLETVKLNHANQKAPKITFFEHIDEVQFAKINETVSLDRLKSVIFDNLFEETFREWLSNTSSQRQPNLLDILNSVVPPTFKKWRNLAARVENASLKLTEINAYVQSLFSDKYKKFLAEIIYIIDNKCHIKNLAGILKHMFLLQLSLLLIIFEKKKQTANTN
jgi:hypothetical protein